MNEGRKSEFAGAMPLACRLFRLVRMQPVVFASKASQWRRRLASGIPR